MRKAILIFFILLCITSSFAQNTQEITNLENKLKTAENIDKIKLLCRLSKAYQKTNAAKSLTYAEEANKIATQNNQIDGQADAINLIANYYYINNDFKKAISKFEEELAIRQKLNDKTKIAHVLYNIAIIHKLSKNAKRATDYYEKSLVYAEEEKLQDLMFQTYQALFNLYYEREKFEKAIEYFNLYMTLKESYTLAEHSKEKELIENKLEEEKVAKENLNNALQSKDSVLNVTITENETLQVNSAKKDTLIEMLNFEKAYKETVIQKQELRQKYLIIISFMLLGLVIGAFFIYKKIKKDNLLLAQQKLHIQEKNEELHQQNEEIIVQRDEIERQRDYVTIQRDEIEIQKRHITDSIHYALRIQNALLPPDELIQSILPEYFILNKPRDIVSGDFYWVTKKTDKNGNIKIFTVVADCTGHGVPGAFMSMLGISFLNEIINDENILQADQIINQLRNDIIKSLRQTGKSLENKDGMDISLCVIDLQKGELEFVGAHNPLYFIHQSELTIIDADNMPVAIFQNLNSFKSNTVTIQKGDCLYMTTDGYIDQFGGENGKKFLKKRFKDFITQIHSKPMKEQYSLLKTNIENWQNVPDANGKPHNQVDDILVMGIRI